MDRTLFQQVLLDEQLFSSFVEFNLENETANNLILFFETVETLLDMDMVTNDHVRSLERFVDPEPHGRRNGGYFPESYSMHVHQICLTYLVEGAPFALKVDKTTTFAVKTATQLAALSPIPLNIFDNLLQLILETLFMTVFTDFAYRFDLSEEDKRDLAPRAVPLLSCITIPEDREMGYPSPSMTDTSFEYQSLHHKTSAILQTIRKDVMSDIYSDIDISDPYRDSLRYHSNTPPISRQPSPVRSRLDQNRLNAKYASTLHVSQVLLKSPTHLEEDFEVARRISASDCMARRSSAPTLYVTTSNDSELFDVEGFYAPVAQPSKQPKQWKRLLKSAIMKFFDKL